MRTTMNILMFGLVASAACGPRDDTAARDLERCTKELAATSRLESAGRADARHARRAFGDLAATNRRIAQAVSKALERDAEHYDQTLVDNLTGLVGSSAANPDVGIRQQDRLLRSSHGVLRDVSMYRLLAYYNNSIRLYREIELFLGRTVRAKDLIKRYAEDTTRTRKYGVVFVEDAGKYYLGQLVELGDLTCAKVGSEGMCRKQDITGFMVRVDDSRAWSPRPGKPASRQRLTDIVIPIIPDESWRRVTAGWPGHMDFARYRTGIQEMAAICSLLARDEKAVAQDLERAATRTGPSTAPSR
jgi:hypothetical protein